jgi:hypothetical protein
LEIFERTCRGNALDGLDGCAGRAFLLLKNSGSFIAAFAGLPRLLLTGATSEAGAFGSKNRISGCYLWLLVWLACIFSTLQKDSRIRAILSRAFLFCHVFSFNYLLKLVAPFDLSAYYPYPEKGALPVLYYVTPLALAGIGWWVWKSAGNGRTIVFAFLFFLVNIMFVLQFKGAGKAFMADRFT